MGTRPFLAGRGCNEVPTRLLRDFMSLALQDLREIGVFSSEVGLEGKCLYFSPCAAKAFASALGKLRIELCNPPNREKLLCLYGAAECLPVLDKRVATATELPTPQPDQLIAEREDYSSSTAAGWSSMQTEIAKLLPDIPREESMPRSLIGEDDEPSKTYLLLRAVLVVSAAAVIIALMSPYLVWFTVLLRSR